MTLNTYRIRRLSIYLIFAGLLCSFSPVLLAQFGGGSGTANSPSDTGKMLLLK